MANSNQNKTVMGILAYIGILVIIPYLVAKDDSFVRFHVRQGLVLLVIEAVAWVAGMMLWMLLPLIFFVNLAMFILSIIGIVNVVQSQEKKLPLVGDYARYFKI